MESGRKQSKHQWENTYWLVGKLVCEPPELGRELVCEVACALCIPERYKARHKHPQRGQSNARAHTIKSQVVKDHLYGGED